MLTFFPLLATIVSLAFAVMTAKQYRERRKPYQLLWTVSFVMFGFATFAEFYSTVWGWTPLLYRLYYVASASLVAMMGAGTMYLLAQRRLANGFLAFTLLVTAVFLVEALRAELITANFVPGGVVAGTAMPSSVRLFAPLLSLPGTLALFGGAVYSWWRTRTAYNLYIALGAAILAGAGGAARGGQAQFLYLGELVGLVVLLWGFLKSREVHRPAE
ncbi:MAG: hypothetical protein ACYC41_03605 [Bacillota bacterium]